MKYFIDTEFIERGSDFPLILLSIGIVAEDGRELYVENTLADYGLANTWVRDNVIPHLCKPNVLRLDPPGIAALIRVFVSGDTSPEFWGYYADYDWVLFAQLFGAMINLPQHFPMYCRDIKQLCDDRGNPKLPSQGEPCDEHNALNDARWNRLAWDFLQRQPH
jgi:3' exoribonuclease, RNase T-like